MFGFYLMKEIEKKNWVLKSFFTWSIDGWSLSK